MGCGSPSKHQITTPTLETPLKLTSQALHVPPLPLKLILGPPEPLPAQWLASASVGMSSSSVLSDDLVRKAEYEDEEGILAGLYQGQMQAVTPQCELPVTEALHKGEPTATGQKQPVSPVHSVKT